MILYVKWWINNHPADSPLSVCGKRIAAVCTVVLANYRNFNLGHQNNIQGEERIEVGGGFAKVWLPNPKADPDCKINQSPIPLGCWFNDSDWSFHSLHEEVGLGNHTFANLPPTSLRPSPRMLIWWPRLKFPWFAEEVGFHLIRSLIDKRSKSNQ